MSVNNISHKDLFLGFLKVGLLGFGGVAAIGRYIVVEERKWLDEKEFAALYGLGKVLPGANMVNVTILVGSRYQGWTGTLAALAGILCMPILILYLMATIYAHYENILWVNLAITGAASAAAGLVIGMGLKMIVRLKPGWKALLITGATLLSVLYFHIGLLSTVLIISPLALLLIYQGYSQK